METIQTFQRRWHTTAAVAAMLGYGLSKTKMLVATGELRSLKDGKYRRISRNGSMNTWPARLPSGQHDCPN
jgi:excisionase family DNA binding protein